MYTAKYILSNNYYELYCTLFTSIEFNMVKIHANATCSLFTANTPNIHVTPNVGSRNKAALMSFLKVYTVANIKTW